MIIMSKKRKDENVQEWSDDKLNASRIFGGAERWLFWFRSKTFSNKLTNRIYGFIPRLSFVFDAKTKINVREISRCYHLRSIKNHDFLFWNGFESLYLVSSLSLLFTSPIDFLISSRSIFVWSKIIHLIFPCHVILWDQRFF